MINVEETKGLWYLLDTETGEFAKISGTGNWPNEDGTEILGLAENLLPLLLVTDAQPTFNAATQRLIKLSLTPDTAAGEIRAGWEVIKLTADEMAANAKAQVPYLLANWRVKAVLDIEGMTATVEDLIAALPDSSEKVVITRAWNGNGDVFRDSATVATLQGVLGLTDLQVDQMFTLAATFNP
jgi:hypothetical protein